MPPANPAAALHATFGHPAFRPGQEAIVDAVLRGRDVLVVMPTGSGKSIGYQLPAILLPGVTLVVSPLIALMKDQVDELARKGVPAATLHSLLSAEERRQVIGAARSGALRLLYVSPERFGSSRFDEVLSVLEVARFAVDEAHCVSEWGHDFRPDYRRLADAAGRCRRADGQSGRPPVVAFTATATPEVRDDIVSLLCLDEPEVFVTGFDRPNLFLDVRRVTGALQKKDLLPGLIGARRALVYASTRKSAEGATSALLAAGTAAATYHAGLDDQERARAQDGFADGSVRVVCATNAFGMGIDRPDVDVVVHFEIPGSLEAYYQEIGRGGRDGRPADATLLWNYVDVRTREFFIEKDEPDDDPRRQRAPLDPVERARKRELDRLKLRRMIAYAETTTCLRATLLRYFGETGAAEQCGHCGNCRRRQPLDADDLLLVRKILAGVARSGERYGARKVAAMLVGDVDELPPGLATLSTTGLLQGLDERRVRAWLDAMVGGGLLEASGDKYRTLSLSDQGREVMADRVASVEMTAPPAPEATRPSRRRRRQPGPQNPVDPPEGTPEPDPTLLDALKGWRRRAATERSVPPYVVMHDRTLRLLASVRPATLEALATIPGIGPSKLAVYGQSLLDLLDTGRRDTGWSSGTPDAS